MGTINDRNDKDLREAEEINKRWQEYIELYNKGRNDQENHDGVVTHLQPNMLEYEVKWALGGMTTKLVEVMEFQLSYFKSWKMMQLKQIHILWVDDAVSQSLPSYWGFSYLGRGVCPYGRCYWPWM